MVAPAQASLFRDRGRVHWNMFRDVRTGKLDRVYLRTCAVYRLLRQRRIDQPRAEQLLKVDHPKRLVELWKSGPLRDL